MIVEIKFHRRAIGYHLVGHLHHLISKFRCQGVYPQGISGTNHLHHLVVYQLACGWVLQQLVGTGVQGYRHTVKWHVPYSLLPSCFQIWYLGSLDAGICHILQQHLELFLLARVVTQINATIALVRNMTWTNLGRTYKCQASHNLQAWELFLQIILQSYTILYKYYNRILVYDRA